MEQGGDMRTRCRARKRYKDELQSKKKK